MMAKQDAQAIRRAKTARIPGYKPRFKARMAKSFLEDAIGPASRDNLTVLRALMRPFHMLENPTAWTKRVSIMGRILSYWAIPKALKKTLYLPEFGPKRPEGLKRLGLKAA